MNRKLLFLCSLVVALGMIAALAIPVMAEGETPPNQTTLSADKAATGHWTRTFNWTIDKSVDPETLDMFTGDSGDVTYTITLTKDSGTDSFYVDGQICVTNGGAVPTEGLSIVDEIQYKWDGEKFEDHTLTTVTLDLGEYDVLGPGESHCYPYSITFTPVDKGPGVEVLYRNVAHVTITNHAGWQPGDNNCKGPDLCPFGPDPKADFSIPAEPTLINDEVNVTDTNGGSWGPFDAGDTITYDKTFYCDDDEGQNDNTATIVETDQSDDASVQVNCYQLDPDKTVATSFDRTYNWQIDKTGDQTTLLLALNQSWVVNYEVTVDLVGGDEYTDSNWAVSGDITVTNNAPIDAELTDVSDLVSPDIVATVDCGVTFPYTIPAGEDLVCSYSADLPNADDRTNTATVTLQNHHYTESGPVDDGTTDFSTDAKDVKFDDPAITEYDTCVDVDDTYEGFLGTVCYKDGIEEGAFVAPHTFTYDRTVGPYAECGEYSVENTATLTTNDNGYTQDDDWTVDVSVPCGGCSLTIGYWKTHAGFGPQPDMVSDLLPLPLGEEIVDTPELAVQFLSFRGDDDVFNASNGINKLYAQLLGAELNIANGADGSAIALKIIEAQAYLLTHDSADWAGLNKNQQKYVLGLMTTFDNYNNGLTGPGHCSQ